MQVVRSGSGKYQLFALPMTIFRRQFDIHDLFRYSSSRFVAFSLPFSKYINFEFAPYASAWYKKWLNARISLPQIPLNIADRNNGHRNILDVSQISTLLFVIYALSVRACVCVSKWWIESIIEFWIFALFMRVKSKKGKSWQCRSRTNVAKRLPHTHCELSTYKKHTTQPDVLRQIVLARP